MPTIDGRARVYAEDLLESADAAGPEGYGDESSAGEPDDRLRRATALTREYTARYPYAVLGGALAVGCFAGAGLALSLRVIGFAGLLALRSAGGLAAESLASHAARSFDTRNPGPAAE